MHVLSEFQLKMSMNDRDNEWQPEIYYLNFLSPREITLPKIIWPKQNSNSTSPAYSCDTFIYWIMQKLKIIGIFLSPRGITLRKIIWLDPNSNPTCTFSWHIYIANFNLKCQFVMEIMSRNWKSFKFFIGQRGITLLKIIRPDPNSNSTCLFSWHIYIANFNSKCQFVMEIMSRNWKLLEFF